MLTRTPTLSDRDFQIADPDQQALMIHAARLGFTSPFIRTLFASPMPASTVNRVRTALTYMRIADPVHGVYFQPSLNTL